MSTATSAGVKKVKKVTKITKKGEKDTPATPTESSIQDDKENGNSLNERYIRSSI